MSLPKDLLNNLTKAMFSLRDMIITIVSDQSIVIPRQPVVFM